MAVESHERSSPITDPIKDIVRRSLAEGLQNNFLNSATPPNGFTYAYTKGMVLSADTQPSVNSCDS